MATKLKMLKPTMQILRGRVPMLKTTRNPEAETRQRGRKWMEIRKRWFSEHPLCVVCEAQGRVSEATQLDHRIALINGGKDDESNYQSLCLEHHKEKSARDMGHRVRPRIGADGWAMD